MKKLVILAVDGVIPFDLSIPCGVFGHARRESGKAYYEVKVCAYRSRIESEFFDFKIAHGLEIMEKADTIIVPGTFKDAPKIPLAVLTALKAAAKRGARIASICSGAFILAEAGLLNGMRATTHWLAAPQLAALYPEVDVDPNVLYVDNGKIMTSAGAAAGLDLCMEILRQDFGAAVAAQAARLAVMPLERSGGQSQFIVHELPNLEGASLGPLQIWMLKNLSKRLTLNDLAKKARMSSRTFSRKFLEQTGTSPLQWLLSARVRLSQELLETTDLSIEDIAEKVGFGSGTIFRDHFRRHLSNTPQAYRQSFVKVRA